ncbi:conserved hypothetical protein [Pediculus humanus corporis]|uniref:DUF4706 domain-containing protein n=1 Tax=Pediculus humanus subsp. corporis TaxID=121224 RepID=E0VYH6_PEDHC|nr:uncharacterized protein Phum_PHUM514150 [Pediculus humanus corporis]EEB18432.1 conserved hypothetical protein [Pediculus humanus corporis]
MKTVNEVAKHYFDTLNPLAERISTDILNIKKINQNLWNNLSVDEQNQIINENLVYPEAILKYALNTDPCQQNINISLEGNVTGAKYVVDENTGVSWRDEHSAPFSWKTPSQIDLTIFTSSNGDNVITNGGFNITKTRQTYVANELQQSDKNLQLKLDKSDTDLKTLNLSPESANVVLVGTCSKLSGFCSKLKFMPSKSYSYEVQTVLTTPTVSSSNDTGFLDKIKASAVLKIQNTLKFVGSKSSDLKKSSNANGVNVNGDNDTQNLVQFKCPATIVKMNKPSPKVSKPKSPPPPPPVLNLPLKTETENSNDSIVKTMNEEDNCYDEVDSEEKSLLGNNESRKSLNVSDCDKNDFESNVKHEISGDLNSLSTECTPLSGPNIDIIPKSDWIA